VVSEQTGAIALAANGDMEAGLSPEHLAERLADLLAGRSVPQKPRLAEEEVVSAGGISPAPVASGDSRTDREPTP
jgi:hypothetical protein